MAETIALSRVTTRRHESGKIIMDVDMAHVAATTTSSSSPNPSSPVNSSAVGTGARPLPSASALSLPLLVAQIVVVILIATMTEYGGDVAAGQPDVEELQNALLVNFYIGVHIMVYIGFGFLMAFLQHGGLAALTHNLMLAALAMQWSILTIGFWDRAFGHHGFDEPIIIDITMLIKAEFVAATALIALGAVLGRVHDQHLLLLALAVPVFQGLNEVICALELQAVDMGGSMLVHAFGALFGMAFAGAMRHKQPQAHARKQAESRCTDNATSNKFAFLGTLFLMVYWPFFNGGLATGNARRRVVINTVLSMSASALSALAASRLANARKNGGGAIDVWDATNAVFAGGVAIGSSSDLVAGPGGAVGMGFAAGVLCVVARRVLPWPSENPCGDTCGVTYVHGAMGLLGGVGGIISAALASDVVYGSDISTLFPGRGAPTNWSASTQALHQLYALLITVGISLVTGALTGLAAKIFIPPPPPEEYYEDSVAFGKED